MDRKSVVIAILVTVIVVIAAVFVGLNASKSLQSFKSDIEGVGGQASQVGEQVQALQTNLQSQIDELSQTSSEHGESITALSTKSDELNDRLYGDYSNVAASLFCEERNSVLNSEDETISVSCGPGWILTGGGFKPTTQSSSVEVESYPKESTNSGLIWVCEEAVGEENAKGICYAICCKVI